MPDPTPLAAPPSTLLAVDPAEAAALAAQVGQVQAALDAAAAAAGRAPGAARLLLATKTQTAARIAAALSAGHRLIGENRAQELRDKAPLLAGLAPEWHFIGPLQKNKIKYVVGTATLIHSVDSLELGLAIADEARKRAPGGVQDILLQVNIAEEATKSGAAPGQALALAGALADVPGLRVRGLMAIPPADTTAAEARRWFDAVAGLAAAGRAAGLQLDELSMGMSGDYVEAIAAGATLVRVGTAIFGARAPVAPAV